MMPNQTKHPQNIQVSRRTLIRVEDIKESGIDPYLKGVCIGSVNTTYTAPTGGTLLQYFSVTVANDTTGGSYERISADNGKTWSVPKRIFEPVTAPEGIWRLGENCLFLDEGTRQVLFFYNYGLYPGGHFTGEVNRFWRIMMRISPDGRHFSEQNQLIQKGFNPTNWAKGVTLGENSAMSSFCAPIRLSNGKIVLPAQINPAGSDFSKPYLIQLEACCFIGEWAGEKLEWTLGEPVKISPALSTRGLCEPALAELSDGSIMMVCRGSNENSPQPQMAGHKWKSLSRDGGYTWLKPEPFAYNTGEAFFSPASGSRLIRNSRNKILYWIGNIVEKNPKENRPRYPLQIAEVDEQAGAIRKETVKVIDDQGPSDSPHLQLSNFRVYEDRVTGEFVLSLARIQEISEKDWSSPAYEYRIAFE